MFETRTNLHLLVFFKHNTKRVISHIVDISRCFNVDITAGAIHIERHLNKTVVFFNQTAFTISTEVGLHLLIFFSAEEVTFHRVDLFLFGDFLFLEGFVDVVFDPGHVLFGGVAEREDVLVSG